RLSPIPAARPGTDCCTNERANARKRLPMRRVACRISFTCAHVESRHGNFRIRAVESRAARATTWVTASSPARREEKTMQYLVMLIGDGDMPPFQTQTPAEQAALMGRFESFEESCEAREGVNILNGAALSDGQADATVMRTREGK